MMLISTQDQKSTSDFKFWRLQKPHAARLLREIIFRWRGSSGRVRGKPGPWTVYSRDCWMEWTGLSRNQLDRALKELTDTGYILREQHRFAGCETRTFIQPTPQSLRIMGKPNDLIRLGNEKAGEKLGEKLGEKAAEKAGEKTDYTSFSTPSIKSITSTPATPAGKGKDGEDLILNSYLEKKEKAANKQYPKIKGPHEKYVQHPSEKYPLWSTYSPKVKGELYQKYLAYIENWKNGKNGVKLSVEDDFDDAAFEAKMNKIKSKA